MPMLPVYRTTFWGGEDVRCEILEDSISESESPRLMPVQPPMLKNQELMFEPGYLTNSDTHYYSEPLVELRRIGRMRSQTLWQLTLSPVEYHPTGRIREHHISYLIHGQENAESKRGSAPRYQAVAKEAFAEALRPLLDWRRQCGYEVGLTLSDSLNRDEIRSIMRQLNPDYILIVGDIEEVGSFSGSNNISGLNGHYADLYYGEFSGDYLPEAIVGRIPVRDSSELQAVVTKILSYEQHPDTLSVQRALIVAGSEGSEPAPTTTNGQVNYVSGQLDFLDTVCFRNPESNSLRDSVLANLSEPFGIINYTAHCDVYGWKFPNVRTGDLANNSHSAIWINNCCESNRFGGDCFGEQLLRMPQGGAIGAIGAGNETFWNEDFFWSVGAKRPISLNPAPDTHLGAFDKLAHGDIATLGELLVAGNMAVTESGSTLDAFYWEVYCLLGDPATPVRIGPQAHIEITHDTTSLGSSSITIHGTPGAIVTICQDGESIARGTVDQHGNLTMELSKAIEDDCILTATLQDGIPVIDTIHPQRHPGARLSASILNPNDTIQANEPHELHIRITNTGSLPANRHHGRIAQTDNDTVGATIMAGAEEFDLPDTIGTDESFEISIPIHIDRPNDDGVSFHLILSSPDENYFTLPIHWQTALPETSCQLVILENGHSAQILLPRHEYQAGLRITNLSSQETLLEGTLIINDNEEALSAIIPADDTTYVLFEIRTPDTLWEFQMDANIDIAGRPIRLNRWWPAGLLTETFEDSLHFTWTNTSLSPWTIDSTIGHDGNTSMRSGAITHQQKSDLSITVDVAADDTISFWVRTSCENDGDRIYFLVDGKRNYSWSGERCWSYHYSPIQAGRHTFCWRYQKNASGTLGEDAAWIDDIRLPFSQWEHPCGMRQPVIAHSECIEDVDVPLTIHPNPANRVITLSIENEGEIFIYDISGRLMVQKHTTTNEPNQISVEHYPVGIYLVNFATASHTSTYKLIISR